MADTSPILSLPYLAPAQAQKHVTHNEALKALDILVQLRVQAFEATQPPAVPQEGAVYALGSGAQGDWAGHDGELAGFTDGGWLFVTPGNGWHATDVATGTIRIWQTDSWDALTLELDNLEGVGIGTTYDATNRLSLIGDATLLSHDGGGHQLKVNKSAEAETASLLFQSNWSGRAEMGLTGNDDWSIKVSPDGSSWTTALRVDRTTGTVGIGPAAGTTATLNVVAGGLEPTILVQNVGGTGGAAFRLIDDLSGGDWKFKTTGDGSFKLRDQGASVDHIILRNTTRNTDFAGPVRPGSYTVATLPAAATAGAGSIAYVSDETDRAVVS